MVDLVHFFVFPIRKLPILVLDSVELDGNGKSDHQQLKQEDGWGTAAFPFLSPFPPNKVQIIPVTVFRKNASEESPGVMII